LAKKNKELETKNIKNVVKLTDVETKNKKLEDELDTYYKECRRKSTVVRD
jgi:hypothetical protein